MRSFTFSQSCLERWKEISYISLKCCNLAIHAISFEIWQQIFDSNLKQDYMVILDVTLIFKI